jgi:hypothetical protein
LGESTAPSRIENKPLQDAFGLQFSRQESLAKCGSSCDP